MNIKHLASYITIGRIIGAFVLLLTKPLSVLFFVVYLLCCISDFLDGYIARKTKTTSKMGEVLDSVADFVLIAVCFVIFVPLLVWELWMVYWIGAIALTRFLSLSIGFVKYLTVSFLHTFANKATGIILACFPILFSLFGITVTVIIVCCIASLSAIEELIIILHLKILNRNIKSLFIK